MYCNSNYAILLLKKYCNSRTNCNRNSDKIWPIWPKFGLNFAQIHCDQKLRKKPQLAKAGLEPTASRVSTKLWFNHSATGLDIMLHVSLHR